MLIDPCLNFGNEAMALNDPRNMKGSVRHMGADAQRKEGDSQSRGRDGDAGKRSSTAETRENGKRASSRKRRHHRKANCGWLEVAHLGFPYVFVYTTQAVAAGEELLIDYGSAYWKHQKLLGEDLQEFFAHMHHPTTRELVKKFQRFRPGGSTHTPVQLG